MSTKKTTSTTKKTPAKATKSSASGAPMKFAKGGYYQDQKSEVWHCANAKQEKVGDGFVIQMQRTENGKPSGDATDVPIEAFTKQLTAAELKEYRAVCQREQDAEADSKTKVPATTEPKSGKTKPAKANKTKATSDTPKKMSALDAAAKVLGETKEPMATKAMIEAMSAKGYWTSPGGQTPSATLYAAIKREINLKGAESRFVKTDKGRFAIAAAN